MSVRIGIRREDKSVWERRTPLTPRDVHRLVADHGIEVWVQPSRTRIFGDAEFAAAGARIEENLSPCSVIFGVKEVPPGAVLPDHTYVFFSHVIKGQPYNMPMLRRLLELRCCLVDYEKATDSSGHRLIFFGRFAGLAGMIDTLWALGQRLAWEGVPNAFDQLLPAWRYADLAEAQQAVRAVGRLIADQGLPTQVCPLVIGFAGYGNVFHGADEIASLLPVAAVEPAALPELVRCATSARDKVHTVVFREEHTVAPVAPGGRFELQNYYTHPEAYRGRFADYLPYLSVLVNCIYWEPRYPRLVTLADLRALFSGARSPRLRVIGDISCDIGGAIEGTVKCSDPGSPVYVYEPAQGMAVDGIVGHGPVVLAVEILPAELPRDASAYFSEVLMRYVPALARADYGARYAELALPAELKRAVVTHHGDLAPGYEYLAAHLARSAGLH